MKFRFSWCVHTGGGIWVCEICFDGLWPQVISICQICKCILPLRLACLTQCEHNFCTQCMSTLFKVKMSEFVPCFTCRTETAYQNVCRPNLQIISRIRDMPVTCNECEKTDSLELMSKHQCHQTPAPLLRNLLLSPSDQFSNILKDQSSQRLEDTMPNQRPISQTMGMCIENTSSNETRAKARASARNQQK